MYVYLKLQTEVFSFPLLVEFLHELVAGYLYNSCTHVYASSLRRKSQDIYTTHNKCHLASL